MSHNMKLAAQDDELFPGLKRSRDLLQGSSRDRQEGHGHGSWPIQQRAGDPFASVTKATESLQGKHETFQSAVTNKIVNPAEISKKWPNGPPPKGPRSYQTPVSPPAAKRVTLSRPSDDGLKTRPSFRHKGDSWRPAYGDISPRNRRNRSLSHDDNSSSEIDQFEPGPKRFLGAEERNLRDVFKSCEKPLVSSEPAAMSGNARHSAGDCDLQDPRSPRRQANGTYFNHIGRESPPGILMKTSAPVGNEAVEEIKLLTVSETVEPLNLPAFEPVKQPKPAGLQFALSNRSNLHDDTNSLHSDDTNSSNIAVSGRSSTTSRPHASRCYACKDTKVSVELAGKAEMLESYVQCSRCPRRYHTRCARGYDKDHPWDCTRCQRRRSRMPASSLPSDKLLVNSPLQQSYDNDFQRHSIENHVNSIKNDTPTLLDSPVTTAYLTADSSPLKDLLSELRGSLGEAMNKKRVEMNQALRSSLPNYLNGWDARDHDSQRNSRSSSVTSRRRSHSGNDAQTVPVSTNTRPQIPPNREDKRMDESGKGSTFAQSKVVSYETGRHGSADVASTEPLDYPQLQPGQDRQSNQSQPDSASTIWAPKSLTTQEQDTFHGLTEMPQIREKRLSLHISNAEQPVSHLKNGTNATNTSRETSYSPPPAITQSQETTSSNIARKCAKCSKSIFSAGRLCRTCHSETDASTKVNGGNVEQNQLPIVHAKANGNGPSKRPTDGENTLEREESATHQERLSSSKRRRGLSDINNNEHIFNKRQRHEYKPLKTAKKTASNVTRGTARITSSSNLVPPTSPPTAPVIRNKDAEKQSVRADELAKKLEQSQKEAKIAGIAAARADELARKLEQSQKESKNAAIAVDQMKASREKEERALAARVQELEDQAEVDRQEIQRLREATSNACQEAHTTSPQFRVSSPAKKVIAVQQSFGPNRTSDVADTSSEEHMESLKARGVVFESDSESECESSFDLPSPKSKPAPRDPLWQRPKYSTDLFEVAPQYAQQNVSDDFIAAKVAEIALRPRRKQTFGKTLAYSKSKGGHDPHQEVCRVREARPMIVEILDESLDLHYEDDGTKKTSEITVSFEDLIGMPKNPVPFLIDGQLAFKEARLRDGRVKRGQEIYRVGP